MLISDYLYTARWLAFKREMESVSGHEGVVIMETAALSGRMLENAIRACKLSAASTAYTPEFPLDRDDLLLTINSGSGMPCEVLARLYL